MKRDIIYRQAAIDAVHRNYDAILDFRSDGETVASSVEDILSELPPAQQTEASCWGCNCQKMERLKEQKTFSEMVHLHDAERREE